MGVMLPFFPIAILVQMVLYAVQVVELLLSPLYYAHLAFDSLKDKFDDLISKNG